MHGSETIKSHLKVLMVANHSRLVRAIQGSITMHNNSHSNPFVINVGETFILKNKRNVTKNGHIAFSVDSRPFRAVDGSKLERRSKLLIVANYIQKHSELFEA